MEMLKAASKSLAKASPLTLVLVGVGAWLALPAFRKTLKTTAVVATKGVMGATETVTNWASNIKEGFEDIMAEANSMPTVPMAGPVVGAAVGGAMGAGVGSAIANTMGATVGAGIGSAVGANMVGKSDETIENELEKDLPEENNSKPE